MFAFLVIFAFFVLWCPWAVLGLVLFVVVVMLVALNVSAKRDLGLALRRGEL